jgi:drug/metabolite transporter (DMT)-like permease
MAARRPDRLTLAAFVGSTLLAGNNAIAVRFSNAELPPFFGAALRFAAAALILFLVVLALRLPLPKGRALAGALVYGALQFGLNYAFIYWSLKTLEPGAFQVIYGVAPLLTFLLAVAHRQERFQWRGLAGALLALSGVGVVFQDRVAAGGGLAARLGWPVVAAVLAAACVAEAAVLFKTFPKTHPVTTNALAMAVGAVVLGAVSGLWGEAARLPGQPVTWAAVAYLVLLGSVGTFVLALYVLARWTASATAYQLVFIPIVTVLCSAWLTGERITAGFVAGGLLVLVGAYVGVIAPAEQLRRLWPGRASASKASSKTEGE